MRMWPKLKLVINGFSTGAFTALFFVAIALDMNPLVFFIALSITGTLAVVDLNRSE